MLPAGWPTSIPLSYARMTLFRFDGFSQPDNETGTPSACAEYTAKTHGMQRQCLLSFDASGNKRVAERRPYYCSLVVDHLLSHNVYSPSIQRLRTDGPNSADSAVRHTVQQRHSSRFFDVISVIDQGGRHRLVILGAGRNLRASGSLRSR